MPAALDLDEELRLAFLIHDVSRLRRKAVDRALKPLGVTRSQWWVLAFLSRNDGLSQVQLADELEVSKVAVGGLLDRLAESDFIERRPDKIDRRLKRVFLTPAGAKRVEDIRQNVAAVESQIAAPLSAAEKHAMLAALRAMKASLHTVLGVNDSELAA